MSRLEWTRYSGDDVEAVIGIMLCREHKEAQRVRPSKGDRGVDVFVPTPEGWDVYQVKSFTGNLKSGQKSKIRDSLRELESYSQAEGLKINSWCLAIPLNPTLENLEWLKEVTAQASFPCHWFGLDSLDGLAAKYTDVVDYYFRDGKERLEAKIREMASATGLFVKASTGADCYLTVADTKKGLVDLHNLVNSLDPHFYYDFSVESESPTPIESPGLVFSLTEGESGCFVTFRVFAKYLEALKDRPIDFHVRVDPSDSEVREKFEEFLDFGTPLDASDGVVANVTANLPGGLGGTQSGPVSIEPISKDKPSHSVRFQVVDPSGEELALCRIRMNQPYVGVRQAGVSNVGNEEGRCFTVRSKANPETLQWNFNFQLHDVSGRAPEKVLHGLRLLNQLVYPNQLRIGPEYGPLREKPIPIPEGTAALIPDFLVRLVEDLITLQEHTVVQLRIPDLDSKDIDQECDDINIAAELLRGSKVNVIINELSCAWDGSKFEEGPAAVLFWVEWSVAVGAQPIEIGTVAVHLAEAYLTLESGPEGNWQVVARPNDSAKLRATLELGKQ
ncbi:hypothetical protein J2S53_003622 [Actinopolyspora lacussalsi]|nr:hypothetical protein [Actinopolyspora lacussalsi]